MKINILHFSDFHFSRQRSDECRRIGVHLAESTAGIPVDASGTHGGTPSK